jgi:Ca-activated chloride channel homolog
MMQGLQSWFGVQFSHGWALWALVLILLPFAWRRSHKNAATLFAPASLASALPKSIRQRLLFLPPLLQVLGLGATVLALAGPLQWQRLPDRAEGIDILLCLDRSSSMAATDMDATAAVPKEPGLPDSPRAPGLSDAPRAPGQAETEALNRLAVAKAAASDFLVQRPDDRIGLIVFARYPDLLSPLTLHHDALLEIMSQVEMVERDGPEDVTGIGTAVATAGQILRTSTTKSKVIILLTDGEENVATAESAQQLGPVQAAQLCLAWGIRVYTIAVGVQVSPAGAQASPVGSKPVQQLASLTGGQFFQASDANAVQEVYRFINLLEKTQLQEPRFQAVERSQIFILVGLLLMLLAQLLSRTVFKVKP